jgi:CheY-like chemotaxis protein
VVDELLSGRRILVVEDETMILMMIEAMLTDLGASVTAAATVERALAMIEAQAFDAAMLDMNLNGDRSHSVAEALVARGVPFVYCTGDNGHRFGDVHQDKPVLKKPFKYEKLIEILTRLVSP